MYAFLCFNSFILFYCTCVYFNLFNFISLYVSIFYFFNFLIIHGLLNLFYCILFKLFITNQNTKYLEVHVKIRSFRVSVFNFSTISIHSKSIL